MCTDNSFGSKLENLPQNSEEEVFRTNRYETLPYVVECGTIIDVEDFLNEGGDLNDINEDGHTGLIMAAIKGEKTIVKLLLGEGALRVI